MSSYRRTSAENTYHYEIYMECITFTPISPGFSIPRCSCREPVPSGSRRREMALVEAKAEGKKKKLGREQEEKHLEGDSDGEGSHAGSTLRPTKL